MAGATYKRRKLMADINVVPYIDVMLVLLIIFMITAPLLKQGVDVELPKASSEPLPPSQKEPIVVTIDRQGLYYLNIGEKPEESIDAETLKQQIKKVLKYQAGAVVLVKGDHRVPYGTVVQAMTFLQSVGVPKVGLMTEPADKK